MNTKASTDIYYHEDSGFLIQVKEDPFLAKKSDSATHLAIEFYPKNIQEYNYLINLSDDITIGCIPFGYVPIREISFEESRSYKSFPTEKKHYLSHSYMYGEIPETINNIDGSLPNDSPIPVLYAVWPIDKKIPSIDHKVCYEICFPIKKSIERNQTKGGPIGMIFLPITINTYDSFIDSYVPMGGIKIRVSYGSFHADYNANSNGSVTINPLMFAIDLELEEIEQLQVSVIYQNYKWLVSRNSSIIPIQRLLGTVYSLWGTMSYDTTYQTYISHQTSVTNECAIFTAANYYYNGIHDFSNFVSSYESGRIIHASTSKSGYAVTYLYQNAVPTIYVYDNYPNINECVGSVIHELGHVHHFYIRGGFAPYVQVLPIVVESFASYVGWNVGEQYYLSKGFEKPYPNYNINWQNRQFWTPHSDDIYSPLFVDLSDEYNQPALVDTIQDVPASVINDMGGLCLSASGCKSHLSTYIGTYFTNSELETYFNYYL